MLPRIGKVAVLAPDASATPEIACCFDRFWATEIGARSFISRLFLQEDALVTAQGGDDGDDDSGDDDDHDLQQSPPAPATRQR